PRLRGRDWHRHRESVRRVLSWQTSGGKRGNAAGQTLTFIERRNAELVAVLGDRAARDAHAVVGEHAGNGGIGQRRGRVLGGDDVADARLDRLRRATEAVVGGKLGGEEVLQFQRALRQLHVLAAGDARDGGFVHADVGGDLLQRQRD